VGELFAAAIALLVTALLLAAGFWLGRRSGMAGRRKIEDELGRQSKQLNLLLEHSSDLIAVLTLDGTFPYMSPSSERLVGYRPAEMVGTNAFSFIHPEDRDRVIASFREGISHPGGPLEINEFRYRHADGSWRLMQSIGNNLHEGGRVAAVVVSLREITAVRSAERTAQQAEKLRALGQMAGGIAHDLNQSLALIAGYGELAREWLDGVEAERAQVAHALEIVARAAMDGGESVKRLLMFARGPADGPREPIEIATLLREVVELTAPRWRDAAEAEARRIVVAIEAAPALCIDGWPIQLREALTNLIFNAVDALPHGGAICLSARPRDDEVEIAVTDDGVGIAPELQAQVFEPFFTTKGERGSGLGLAQVFGIVERHGGRVALESVPERGTTVRLVLPRGEVDAGAPSPTHTPEVGKPSRPLRILAIDDEPAIADLVAEVLGRRGHAVTVAHSVEAGLRRLEEGGYDLVISDLGLGAGVTGWDLAAAVRDRWPGVRFALATGWGAGIDLEEAHRRGVDTVLAKPFRSAELVRLVGG
jgi:PAS domain S-box-containing protein